MVKMHVWAIQTGHDSTDGWRNFPNSAGGVSVRFNIKNVSGKTIKYAGFWFTPYNAVNDAVSCSIKKISSDGVRYTGPLESSRYDIGILWENAWYNHTITSVRLDKVDVEYMDGTSETLTRSDISQLQPDDYKPAGGCYVATCVYGSYDCPEVWTLRRYRDHTLAATWYGRAFIRTYYAVSPTLVRWLGHTKWFRSMWQGKLDRMVRKLNASGVENTPYDDIAW